MGEVIRKDAAAADIFADVQTTLTNATAKGGDWQTAAGDRLGSIVTLMAGVTTRLTEARAAAGPAVAELEVADDAADKLLGRISDDIWNLVGRPGTDPALDILFPGGVSYYASGSTEEQPVRMNLLADLLESSIHPRLEAAAASAFATEIREAATALDGKVDAARPLRARLKLAERMQSSVSRTGQVALSRLKALWKADGKSEAEIHAVIPDRPARRRAPDEPAPA
jgi:hypothetical protein